MQIFLFAQGLTARKFEGNEKFFRGDYLRSRIFLLAAYMPSLRIEMVAFPACIFFNSFSRCYFSDNLRTGFASPQTVDKPQERMGLSRKQKSAQKT